jgi:AraC-like DNA-binding protein
VEHKVSIEDICRLIATHAHRQDIGLPGVRIIEVTRQTDPLPSIASPMLAFSMQGAKRIALGDNVYEQGPGTFMVFAVDLPITSHYTHASRAEPYLGFGLDLRSSSIAELLVEAAANLPGVQAPAPPGLTLGSASPEMLDAIARLLGLIEHPNDAAVLAPLLEREILWRVLSGPAGPAVRQIGLNDSSLTHIGRAIHHLRSNVFEPIQVEELAKLSAMGVSSFHRQFRNVTAMSPIQYQKRLRLQEARLRLLRNPHEVAAVGYAVGYGSASQFSREYRREFGVPPSEDALRMREQGQMTA